MHQDRSIPITTVLNTPVISIAAWSGSGKTTFLEQVVKLLHEKGVRCGVIKHHSHDTDIDVVGKDSWRYSQAGGSPVIISSPTQYSVVRQMPKAEAKLIDLCLEIASECDVILTEGYKYEAMTKIELSRMSHKPEPVEDHAQLLALITDDAARREAFAKEGKQAFDLHDYHEFAEFITSLLNNDQYTYIEAPDHSKDGEISR